MRARFEADFGRTSEDYAKYRAGFPASFFSRMSEVGIGRPKQRILDVGTGTGTLARGFAWAGADVVGVDPAAEQIEHARRLAAEAGLDIVFTVASAEATEQPDATFDVVTAGQCWHWLDPPRALAEAARVLGPAGRLVIASFDWLPVPGSVVAASERLILEHNPAWPLAGGDGRHPEWRRDLETAGYRLVDELEYDHEQPYSHEAWRGRIRASAGVAGSLDPGAIARFDAAHQRILTTEHPTDPLLVPHRVSAVIARPG